MLLKSNHPLAFLLVFSLLLSAATAPRRVTPLDATRDVLAEAVRP